MSELDCYDCQESFKRLDDYVDRELDDAEAQRVAEHLEECASCAIRFDFEEGVLDEVRAKLRRIQAPEDLMARISKQIGSASSGSSPSE